MLGWRRTRRALIVLALLGSAAYTYNVLTSSSSALNEASKIDHTDHVKKFIDENTNSIKVIHDNELTKRKNEVHESNADVTLPWFFKHGTLRPLPGDRGLLWPHEDSSDRIVDQLMFRPENVSGIKRIHVAVGGFSGVPNGRQVFIRDKCPVDACELVGPENAHTADALIFKDRFIAPRHNRNPNQVWILYLLECPLHTQNFKNLGPVFNWTATYRHDSDIVAPYEKWATYPKDYLDTLQKPLTMKHNKTKKVAWFVSNCAARNKRLEYARKLSNYIDVDIYGACGDKKCPRFNRRCMDMIDNEYKFYLAFENSNCRDYITEKFFVNGLGHNVVPIVMGAERKTYERSSPPNSFIHVDEYSSPQELAKYLKMLDEKDALWEQYLKTRHTGEFINTYFWCRLCAMLHDSQKPRKTYTDIHEWWAGSEVCVSGKWPTNAPVISDNGAAPPSAAGVILLSDPPESTR